jgi:hypothetical protein
MKNITLLSTFCFLLFSLVVHAQTPPNAFNYSAVARNAAGQPIATTTIGVQISILKTSATGTVQYSENHFVNTDAFGLFNLVIGAGAVQSGSMATIDWSNDNYYLKVGMDANGGTNFLTMGTTQLLSVPYAMHAKTAENVSASSLGNIAVPNIITSVSNIGANGATFTGDISNVNGNSIGRRGFVISTSPNPNFYNSICTLEFQTPGIGIYSISIYDSINNVPLNGALLNPGTTYYVRAFVNNDNDITFYGNEVSFTTLSLGQTGPSGGVVFFDKGNNVGGWQYLEAAPYDQSSGIAWGCDGTLIFTNFNNCGFGFGESITNTIVANCNEVSYAAKICDNLVLGGQSDWFLPSREELKRMITILNLNGIYWSCCEASSTDAFGCDITNTYQYLSKTSLNKVRAIRAY